MLHGWPSFDRCPLVSRVAIPPHTLPFIYTSLFVRQASSPDEVALVKFAESVGLRLCARGQHVMRLEAQCGRSGGGGGGGGDDDDNADADAELTFDVLQIFPFTSESKRMGIIVRAHATGRITFYLKVRSVKKKKIVFPHSLQ